MLWTDWHLSMLWTLYSGWIQKWGSVQGEGHEGVFCTACFSLAHINKYFHLPFTNIFLKNESVNAKLCTYTFTSHSQPLIRININIIYIQVYLKHSSKSSVKAVLTSPVVVLHICFYNTKILQHLKMQGKLAAACIPEWSFWHNESFAEFLLNTVCCCRTSYCEINLVVSWPWNNYFIYK